MPLMNDAREQKQKQIQNFVERTSSDESAAKTYLSNHNWDIDEAVQSFFKMPNRHIQQYSNGITDMVSFKHPCLSFYPHDLS